MYYFEGTVYICTNRPIWQQCQIKKLLDLNLFTEWRILYFSPIFRLIRMTTIKQQRKVNDKEIPDYWPKVWRRRAYSSARSLTYRRAVQGWVVGVGSYQHRARRRSTNGVLAIDAGQFFLNSSVPKTFLPKCKNVEWKIPNFGRIKLPVSTISSVGNLQAVSQEKCHFLSPFPLLC